MLFNDKPNSLIKKLSNDKLSSDFVLSDSDREKALEDYASLNKTLATIDYEEIAKKYGEKKRKNWYHALIGSNKIEDLAINLNESGLYEIPYRDLSSFIHGEDILHSNLIFLSTDTVGLKALRDISQVKTIVDSFVIIIERSIIHFIQKKMDSDKPFLIKLKPLMDRGRVFREKEIVFQEPDK